MTDTPKLLVVIFIGIGSTFLMCCSDVFSYVFVPIGFIINGIADYGIYVVLSVMPVWGVLFIVACVQQMLGYDKLSLFLSAARFFGIIGAWGLPLIILCNNCRGTHTVIP